MITAHNPLIILDRDGVININKPESYGKRSIPIAEFIEEVGRGIAFHNARAGRRAGCSG